MLEDEFSELDVSSVGCDETSVKVTNPAKVGEGISSYVVYRVISKFNDKEFLVLRRFSDFLGLHERLVSKYLSEGVIVPPVPSKDMLATTKVKISKDVSAENEFVERRGLSLFHRFLLRVLAHQVLRIDEDIREFLQYDGELPRATNTQLISGASAIKVMKNLGDAIGKLTYKVDDPEEVSTFYRKLSFNSVCERFFLLSYPHLRRVSCSPCCSKLINTMHT
ncbi:unnamed protein product [Trichobilharzia regenti]|nr:unnamed protein product [Trichobilharzia regenti]